VVDEREIEEHVRVRVDRYVLVRENWFSRKVSISANAYRTTLLLSGANYAHLMH
jgi:hypothetical protein